MIVHKKELDIVPGGTKAQILLNQNDADFQLQFTLSAREGEFTIEEETTASIRGTKGKGGAYEAVATVSEGVVTVQGDANMTDEAGQGRFELCLTHGGKELHTANFLIKIEEAPVQGEAVQQEGGT